VDISKQSKAKQSNNNNGYRIVPRSKPGRGSDVEDDARMSGQEFGISNRL
jgi:hypothetical protein